MLPTFEHEDSDRYSLIRGVLESAGYSLFHLVESAVQHIRATAESRHAGPVVQRGLPLPLCVFAASRQGVVPLAGRRPLRENFFLFFSVSPGAPGAISLCHGTAATIYANEMKLKVYDFRREEDLRNVLVTPQIRSRFVRLEAGSEARHFHSHDLGHEIFLILQGRCRFEIDGEEAELRPGQMCIALVDQPHRLTVVGDEPVVMYLSVTPHIVPTHTGRTPEGGRLPPKFGPPSQYDAKRDTDTADEELIDRYIELARAASEKLLAGAEKAAELKEANRDGKDSRTINARNEVWEDLRQTYQSIYELGEVWNNLAPRAGKSD